MPESRRTRRTLAVAVAVTAGAAIAAYVTNMRDEPVTRTPTPSATARPAPRARAADGTAPPAAPEPAPSARRDGPPPPAPGRQILLAGEPARTGTPGEIARALVAEHRDALGLAAMPGALELAQEFDSLSGHHVRWRQALDGVPVFGSEVSAHVAKDGRPLLVAADVFPVEGALTRPDVAPEAARAAVADLLGDDGSSVETKVPQLVVLPEGRRGRLAWRVDARTDGESARVFVDAATGVPLRADDLLRAADGSAEVFVPNPVYAKHSTAFADAGDADSVALTAARDPVILRRLDGSGYLRGPWADVTRTRKPTMSAALDWTTVTRSNDAFEQLMAYYHVDTTQQRLRDLGITNVNARSIPIDAHAFGYDNSYYDGFEKALLFGDGGVDDAEDGDVIHHEYGHAMQDDQVPDFGVTEEGGAMGEGFGDFLAVSFHTSGDQAFDAAFASWDAIAISSATPPALRRVDTDKHYPVDVTGEIHADGEIWSRFLWDLRGLLGVDQSLRVVVESHFMLSSSAGFLQGANAVLAANEAVRGGADADAIRALLADRGMPYTQPEPPPGDDDFEENDDADHAIAVGPGFHLGLVLADEDWFALTVPPNRRFHVRTIMAPGVASTTEVLTTDGDLVSQSRALNGSDGADAAAGPGGATFRVRVHRPSYGGLPPSYDLNVTDAPLPQLRPNQTRLSALTGAARDVVRIRVGPARAQRGVSLRVATKGVAGGPPSDVRVTSPSGLLIADFGDGATDAGAVVSVPATEPGDWIVEVRPRAGATGTFRVRARFN
jgi:Zn-dependent metalloprotease